MPSGSDDPSPGPVAWSDSFYAMIQGFRNHTDDGIVDISPVPLNATQDLAQRPVGDEGLYAEDLAWERFRGKQEYEDWLQAEMRDVDVASVMALVGDKPRSSLAGNSTASTSRDSKAAAGGASKTGPAVGGSRKLKMLLL